MAKFGPFRLIHTVSAAAAMALVLPAVASAQPGPDGAPSARAMPKPSDAIERLKYLKGTWVGEKVEKLPNGQERRSPAKDVVSIIGNGNSIVVDGGDGVIVFTGHPAPGKVNVTGLAPIAAFTTVGDVKDDGSVEWVMANGPMITIFTIAPTKSGWFETGKISPNAGKNWLTFEVDFHRDAD